MLRPMVFMIFLLSGCHRNHHDQISFKAFERKTSLPAHTVRVKEKTPPPLQVTYQSLKEGQEHYENLCLSCHGVLGDGRGIVTHRGLFPPSSFLQESLLKKGPEYFVKIMAEGYGRMPSFQRRLAPQERWKVAHYVKVLQISRHFPLRDLDPEDQEKIP